MWRGWEPRGLGHTEWGEAWREWEPRAVTESLSEVRDNVSWSQEIREMGIKNQLSIYPTGGHWKPIIYLSDRWALKTHYLSVQQVLIQKRQQAWAKGVWRLWWVSCPSSRYIRGDACTDLRSGLPTQLTAYWPPTLSQLLLLLSLHQGWSVYWLASWTHCTTNCLLATGITMDRCTGHLSHWPHSGHSLAAPWPPVRARADHQSTQAARDLQDVFTCAAVPCLCLAVALWGKQNGESSQATATCLSSIAVIVTVGFGRHGSNYPTWTVQVTQPTTWCVMGELNYSS